MMAAFVIITGTIAALSLILAAGVCLKDDE